MNSSPLIVFYDNSCPLCRREISVYERLDPLHPIHYEDVSTGARSLPDGLDYESAMARFHVQRPDGTLLSGARAFFELWSRLPYWRWLTLFRHIPGVPWLGERIYRLFLRFRPRLQQAVCRLDRDTTSRS